jgi:TonB family protein
MINGLKLNIPVISPAPEPPRIRQKDSQTGEEVNVHLLLEWQSEAERWRRLSMFLFALIFHGILAVLLIFSPQLFQRGASFLGIEVHPAQNPETTFLTLPPDVLKRPKLPPKTNLLSDQNRLAQGPSPKVNPDGIRMPYSRGNTKLPEVAGGGHPAAPPAPPPPANPAPKVEAQNQAPPQGPGNSSNPQSKPKDNLQAQLQLQDVNKDNGGGGKINIPFSSPGQSIQDSVRAAAQGRAQSGGVPGPGEGNAQFQNLNPNFSTAGPVILSDTRGVNFGPYLARVVYVVRQNWYAVIPESARLGEKGRVGIVFEIIKDGSVPQIRLVASSGSQALDLAALASIRASNPFPPLPTEFTGNHLVLQFLFLYNEGTGGY